MAARVFGLAVGAPSPVMDALARAPLPFSAWAEGDDLVQAGPSRLAWAVVAPAGARLRFTTSARHGAPSFRVEAENDRGERSEVWQGGPEREVAVDLPAQAGDVLRLWLHVESEDGTPAWGAWKGLVLAGADPSPPPAAVSPIVAASRPEVRRVQRAGGRPGRGRGPPLRMLRTCPAHDAQHRSDRGGGNRLRSRVHPAVFTRSAMASVWTSQLPDEHHGSVSYDEPLPTGVPTLAGIVSAAGITTAGFVGNNMAGTAFGLDRGFSEFYRLSYRAEVLREYLHGWLVEQRAARASWPTSTTASRTTRSTPGRRSTRCSAPTRRCRRR